MSRTRPVRNREEEARINLSASALPTVSTLIVSPYGLSEIKRGSKPSKEVRNSNPLKIAEKVRNLYHSLDREVQSYLGPPPFTGEVKHLLVNYRLLQGGLLPNRQRYSMASCTLDADAKVIAYSHVTLMRNATATAYERNQIGLSKRLNYLQIRHLMVDPKYWGTGAASELLTQQALVLNEQYENVVADVLSINKRVQGFLKKQGFSSQFSWETAKGTQMQRMERNADRKT